MAVPLLNSSLNTTSPTAEILEFPEIENSPMLAPIDKVGLSDTIEYPYYWDDLMGYGNTGGGLFDSYAIQQQAVNTIVRLLREARGYGLGVIILDQSPGDLATTAMKLPGITITHFLKDSRERALVGSQANLTEEQTQYLGALARGEAIVHSGFTEQAVNVQVPHFREKLPSTIEPWTNERIVYWMEAYYSSRPYMKKQQLPTVDSWIPDPVVLLNLKYITESPDFIQEYEKCTESGPEAAEAFVRRVVSKHLQTTPAETQRYVNVLVEYLKDDIPLEGNLDEGL